MTTPASAPLASTVPTIFATPTGRQLKVPPTGVAVVSALIGCAYGLHLVGVVTADRW